MAGRENTKLRNPKMEKCKNSSAYALRGSGVTKGSEQ
jgi:hypothetical protein